MGQPDSYFLGYRQMEQERLQQQAQQLAHEAHWLSDQIGIPRGGRVLEIGCGPQGCLDLLAERVGAEGVMVGVESNEDAVRLARQFVTAHHLANVELHLGDGKATGLPRASFDLAFARLVLVNVPAPERIVEEMVALVRPGGAVALPFSGHQLSILRHDRAVQDHSGAENRGLESKIAIILQRTQKPVRNVGCG